MKTSIDQTEALLREGLVQPPADFRDRVMQQVAEHERHRCQVDQADRTKVSHSSHLSWWQWLVLLPGSVIGAAQVMRFVFSMWFATSAG